MAISTNFTQVEKQFRSRYWESIKEFERYFLDRISETTIDTNYYTTKEGLEIKIPPINHHPELKEYEVWMEGYAATGESGTASLLGKVKARNFAQACHIIECEAHLKWMKEINEPDYTQYVDAARWDYDPHQLRIWNCGLFWSKELAQKSFG